MEFVPVEIVHDGEGNGGHQQQVRGGQLHDEYVPVKGVSILVDLLSILCFCKGYENLSLYSVYVSEKGV